MQKNPLVIALLDLENTTKQVGGIQKMLEWAYNERIAFVPIQMEIVSQVYFRDHNLDSFRGMKYAASLDDKRAIRNFIGQVFDFISRVTPGREKIFIYHSDEYADEAKMLYALVSGLHLHSKILLETNPEKITEQ